MRHLSITVNCYCCLWDEAFISKVDVTRHMYLYCIDSLIEDARCILRMQYWLTELRFKIRARQTYFQPAARVINVQKHVEVFKAFPDDLLLFYFRFIAFELLLYTSMNVSSFPRFLFPLITENLSLFFVALIFILFECWSLLNSLFAL